uniref:F-box domain-containing protein n=1 Tax=Kalanchoe fedtschenkoi TaxID=63787 RepID=A0A7N1A726_KALFE
MARTGKRTQMAEPQDRISNLPDNVIENILDRLPLVDTVATSILSRKWRHHWTRVSNLLLDENFAADVRELGELRNEEYTQEMMESDYMDAVNTFLLFHSGPMRNFVLHLPFNVEGPLMQAYVDKWIRVLSHKGVRELTLDARARTFMVFNLPSYVFDYLELRHLELRFCQFKFPYNFGGFQNLTSLQLLRVRIYEDGLTTLIANGPLLENLSIERYFGSLSINAPKLKTLSARSCGFKDFALRNVSDVVTISLRHTWTKRSATRPFRCDILKFWFISKIRERHFG